MAGVSVVMAHTERRGSALREGQIAVFTGALFGATHTISGHSLDNWKAACQLDGRYAAKKYARNPFLVLGGMWRNDGWRAFARGFVPPLWGSSIYRSVMISSYEASYTYLDGVDHDSPLGGALQKEYLGVRPMVLAAALCCSVSRVSVESPIEYCKVMGQTGRPWVLKDVYRGGTMQTARTCVMLSLIFVPYDVVRRKTDLFATFYGQFAVTMAVCSASYGLAWPLETLKNLSQAGLPRPESTLAQRIRYVGGFAGLYRGVLPGMLCGGFRNGMAMVVMARSQRLATVLGLRDVEEDHSAVKKGRRMTRYS